MIIFFFYFSVVHLDLPVPTHSSPTRRSSALPRPTPARAPRDAALVRIPARSLPSGPARAAAGEPVRVLPPLHPRRGAVAAARGQHRPDRAGGGVAVPLRPRAGGPHGRGRRHGFHGRGTHRAGLGGAARAGCAAAAGYRSVPG